MNFPRALAGFSSWLFKPELAEDSPDNDSPDNDTVNPWRELLQKINVADLPDSSFSSDRMLSKMGELKCRRSRLPNSAKTGYTSPSYALLHKYACQVYCQKVEDGCSNII